MKIRKILRRKRKILLNKRRKALNIVLDFFAFYTVKLLKKTGFKLSISYDEKDFFSSRIAAYSQGFLRERIKPKKFRAKNILRNEFIRKGIFPRPELILKKSGTLSQHDEHQILLKLIDAMNLSDSEKVSIEIGSGHQGGNSGVLTYLRSFRSLWFDGDETLSDIARHSFSNCNLKVLSDWVTAENIVKLISENHFEAPSYIGIDIDGNDYWIFKELLTLCPRIICVEYNPVFGLEAVITIKYSPRFSRKEKDKIGGWVVPKGIHGASIMAFYELAKANNYRLVANSNPGSNLFFIQNHLLPEVATIDPTSAFQLPRKQNLKKIIEKQADIGFKSWLELHDDWLEDLKRS